MTTIPIATSSKRIEAVDCVRGFAVVGIILIHFLEHLNFYAFPEPTSFDQTLWDIVFYLGASKMYAIFALLFGFSCYIQHHNQEERGHDFRLRFIWRMILLFLWGMIDLLFFNGDILCTYAVLGLLLVPLVKASDKVLLVVAFVAFCQPVEIIWFLRGIMNPDTTPLNMSLGPCWKATFAACKEGGFWDVARANLENGLQINFGWALENGRLTQTFFLFVLGMWAGRKNLFQYRPGHMRIWLKMMVAAIILFAISQLLLNCLPFDQMAIAIKKSLKILLQAWRNFGMMVFYVTGLLWLYYRTPLHKAIHRLACIGKMSLTCYLLQSIVGGFLFYNWGLSLYEVSGHCESFLMGIVFCIVLYGFCKFWTKNFRRGPLEECWSKMTYLNFK